MDLGLGRGVDATNPKPWLNKSAFQVREATKENVIGTDEGNLYHGFVTEVESTQHLQASLGASVPVSELVSIGVDSELSRTFRGNQKSVGTKIITRTISFHAGFADIDKGERYCYSDKLRHYKQPPQASRRTFEGRLCEWISNKLKDKQHLGYLLYSQLSQDELIDYCYKFISTYSITHYVHSLTLGASFHLSLIHI